MVAPKRLAPLGALTEGTWPLPADEAIFRIPFVPIAVVMLLSLLGLGRAAPDLVIDKAPQKRMHHTIFARRNDCVGVQIQFAEAALKLATARLQLRRIRPLATDLAGCEHRTAPCGPSAGVGAEVYGKSLPGVEERISQMV